MGQAKNRGTFEQRVAQAKERQAREHQALAERLEAERKARREAVIAARVAGHDVVVSPPRGRRPTAALALMAALGIVTGTK